MKILVCHPETKSLIKRVLLMQNARMREEEVIDEPLAQLRRLQQPLMDAFEFIENPSMTLPRRTHKKKRIYKKWALKYRKPDPKAIMMDRAMLKWNKPTFFAGPFNRRTP